MNQIPTETTRRSNPGSNTVEVDMTAHDDVQAEMRARLLAEREGHKSSSCQPLLRPKLITSWAKEIP
jgi:hypothetical protein